MSEEVNRYLSAHNINEESIDNQKQDIIFVQYNYCIHDKTLFIFWPLMWNVK